MIYFEESNGEVWFRKTAETHPVAIVGERDMGRGKGVNRVALRKAQKHVCANFFTSEGDASAHARRDGESDPRNAALGDAAYRQGRTKIVSSLAELRR